MFALESLERITSGISDGASDDITFEVSSEISILDTPLSSEDMDIVLESMV